MLPSRHEAYHALSSFTLKQKTLLLGLAVVFVASVTGIIWNINDHFLITVAVPGGALTEGIVGAPAHANPLLAITDADRDVTALIYSGLLKLDGQGKLVPDLAEGYEISTNGLVYTFKLKAGLTWSDGEALTADDILFTVAKAQDPLVKSSRRAAWEGVRVEKLSDREIRFILKKPYAAFLENGLLGILPKHLWQTVKPETFLLSDLNQKGIGSGPYKIVSVTRDSASLPTIYRLMPFPGHAGGSAKITDLTLRFYDNDEKIKTAYERGEIDSFGSIPPVTAELLAQSGATIRPISLPRTFAVFFNQGGAPALTDRAVRQALLLATDKKSLIDTALKGAGVAINGPLPPGSEENLNPPTTGSNPTEAITLLEKNGWIKDRDGIRVKTDSKKKTTRLEFTIATAAAPELKVTANALAEQWKKIGAGVTVQVYELSDLDQNLIRTRKFDALLFGEALGRDPDLYSFWHSSQRLAPGLNITQYTNATVDKLLEAARRTSDPVSRAADYEKFQTELAKDVPAIFLFSPYFLYLLPDQVKGATFPSLLVPAERFSTIADWYIDHNRVWKIFTTK